MAHPAIHRYLPTIYAHWRTAFYGVLLTAVGLTGGFVWLARSYQPVVADTRSAGTPSSTPEDAFRLEIPKLGVTAPVIANVSGTDEKAYLKAIEGGVAQMERTSLPDQPGNMFIFGHSSYYKTKPGDYKEVFKQLNQLKPGDELTVRYHASDFRYQVTDSKIVGDSDWSILHPTIEGADKTLTLMTCWPPGTLAKRYVVHAKQVTTLK